MVDRTQQHYPSSSIAVVAPSSAAPPLTTFQNGYATPALAFLFPPFPSHVLAFLAPVPFFLARGVLSRDVAALGVVAASSSFSPYVGPGTFAVPFPGHRPYATTAARPTNEPVRPHNVAAASILCRKSWGAVNGRMISAGDSLQILVVVEATTCARQHSYR